jgi:hypothetical protein
MSDKLEDLMYESGLTAQGCWDELDDYNKTAIMQFAKLIVVECARIADNPAPGCHSSFGKIILEKFGYE